MVKIVCIYCKEIGDTASFKCVCSHCKRTWDIVDVLRGKRKCKYYSY